MTKSARITKIKKCNKNCILSIPSIDMLLFSARHHFFHAPLGSTVDEKEAVLLRGPGNGGYGSEEAANTGGKGRVVMRGILSHTFHFMYYLTVCDTNVSPGIYQVHQITVETLDQSHNNNKGEDVLHSPQGDRMKDV